ncbi:hypothetical protein ACLXBB_27560, partial [Pseudomonas aeruginosa]
PDRTQRGNAICGRRESSKLKSPNAGSDRRLGLGALGAVLALREQGKTEQAATQLAELQKRFPGENLVERLERLATIAASAKKRP